MVKEVQVEKELREQEKIVEQVHLEESKVVDLEISLAWARAMFKFMALIKKSRLSSSMLLVWSKLKLKSKNSLIS